ncbi:membrane hypothetical protein [Rhodospirillaceae bacterium LM-1]|nr:membrane hypothetical protein [Rhodospirillaceae bacterium LM-1]
MTAQSSRLTYYDTFTDRDLTRDRERGEEDGKKDFPLPGTSDLSPYEVEQVKWAETDLGDFMQEIQDQRAKLEDERDSKQQYVESYSSRRENLLKEREARLTRMRESDGDLSAIHEQKRTKFLELDDQLKSKAEELRRPLQVYLGFWVYAFLFLGLALSEIPINLPAMQQVFKESLFVAFFLAVTLGFLLIFFAHMVAKLLRQQGELLKDVGKIGRILFWSKTTLLLLLSGGIIWLVYDLRLAYLSTTNGTSNITTESGIFFLIINISIFVTGLLLSWLRHDPDPDYHRLDIERNKAADTFETHERNFQEKRRRFLETNDVLLRNLANETSRYEAEVKIAQNDIDNLTRRRDRIVNRVLFVLGRKLAAYQNANQRARKMGLPTYFGDARISLEVDKLRDRYERM